MKQFTRALVQFYKRTDHFLTGICLLLSALSLTFLWGIYLSGYVVSRTLVTQFAATLLGLGAAVVISAIDYRLLAKLWKLFVPVAVGLVVLTYFVGEQRYEYVDDKAWLRIPGLGFTFQPSEILKIAFILTFALHLEKMADSINDPKTLLSLCAHGALPVLLIVLQGDHGTAMVFAAIFVCMLFAAGLDLRYIAGAAFCAVVASPVAWFFVLDDDKRGRILSVWDPSFDPQGVGWQQAKGLLSIGSGQLWGKGVFTGQHQQVPEMHNDFIFAFVGESTGFMGCVGVIVLLALLCLALLLNARRATDTLGRNICVGVLGMVAFQSIWVIAMCLSLLPVAGVTLPLLSAGGTSVTLTYAAIGLVLSVHRHASAGLFDGH